VSISGVTLTLFWQSQPQSHELVPKSLAKIDGCTGLKQTLNLRLYEGKTLCHVMHIQRTHWQYHRWQIKYVNSMVEIVKNKMGTESQLENPKQSQLIENQ